MKLDASKYEWILKSSPEMEAFIKQDLETMEKAMEKAMGRVDIIRDFQACLNEALKVGRQVYGEDNIVKAEAYSYFIVTVSDTWLEQDHSYNDLFFGWMWFLDMIEWKVNDNVLCLNPEIEYDEPADHERIEEEMEYRGKQYHLMQLVILESDELRIKRVLDNMKWFITKK